jgi:DNA invertase Pin-like site-specific DNA recombinase
MKQFIVKEEINMHTKQKAWLYCRIDAPEDAHGALKQQKEKLDGYARQMGFEVVGASEDLGGGMDYDRAGLKDAMAAAKAGEVDSLIVHSVSRIGRDTAKTVDFLRQLKGCGVKVYSPLEGEISVERQAELLSQLLT